MEPSIGGGWWRRRGRGSLCYGGSLISELDRDSTTSSVMVLTFNSHADLLSGYTDVSPSVSWHCQTGIDSWYCHLGISSPDTVTQASTLLELSPWHQLSWRYWYCQPGINSPDTFTQASTLLTLPPWHQLYWYCQPGINSYFFSYSVVQSLFWASSFSPVVSFLPFLLVL